MGNKYDYYGVANWDRDLRVFLKIRSFFLSAVVFPTADIFPQRRIWLEYFPEWISYSAFLLLAAKRVCVRDLARNSRVHLLPSDVLGVCSMTGASLRRALYPESLRCRTKKG